LQEVNDKLDSWGKKVALHFSWSGLFENAIELRDLSTPLEATVMAIEQTTQPPQIPFFS